MMFLPAGRFRTRPRPPDDLDARLFAAVIRPPLLFFAICFISSSVLVLYVRDYGLVTTAASSVTAAIRANALPFNVAPVLSDTA